MTGTLSAVRVATLRTPGMSGDGGGPWLQVTGNGAKSWIFRFTLRGRARAMGLGSASPFSLAEARDEALVCRTVCAGGNDPIEARKAERQGLAARAAHALAVRIKPLCASPDLEQVSPSARRPEERVRLVEIGLDAEEKREKRP